MATTLSAISGDEKTVERVREQAVAELRAFDREADGKRGIPAGARAPLGDLLAAISSLDPEERPGLLLAAVEALATGSPTLAHAVLPKIQGMLVLRTCGTDEQVALARPFVDAGTRTAFFLTESGGRGIAEWETEATRAGDTWTVSGRKVAALGDPQGLGLLAARRGSHDAELFLVDVAQLRPAPVFTGLPATMALGATRLSSAEFPGCAIPDGARLSGADDRPFVVTRSIALARLLAAAVALGAAVASMDYAIGWVTERRAFGKKLSSFEGVAFDIADHDTRLSLARLALEHAASRIAGAVSGELIDRIVGRTLAKVTGAAVAACTDGVQLMGVHGILHEHPQELYHRTASSLSVLDVDPLHGGFAVQW